MDPQRLRERLAGVAFTTPVPFTDDTTAVDHDALAQNVSGLYEAGARVFVPCGNTGEYYALTDEERVAVVETHVEAAGEDATVVAGAGGNVAGIRRLASSYESAGVDGLMVMHPNYTYIHEAGLKSYYHRVCDATDLGVVVYKRGPEVTRDVLVDLSEREDVAAVKFAVSDVVEFSQTIEDADGDVTWVNGSAERYACSFAVEGAEGYTTGLGNFAPHATLALFDALERGQWDRARSIQRSLRPIEDLRDEPGERNSLSSAYNVPVVKHGMDLAGYRGGPVRDPLVNLPEPDQRRLESVYRQIEGQFGDPA